MDTNKKTVITIGATVNAPVEKVWQYWGEPQHITQWAFASEDWHVPHAENDLRTNGKFSTTMAAKDGSFSFEFGGIYTNVEAKKLAEYELGDGRKVKVSFSGSGNETKVTQSFEAEGENPLEMQRAGWQAILNNMKSYTEGN
ncbi:MAG TPA: SRPBCC family protein [Cyclobacteriaceae bacterium]|nr:SRPBCC family protein [Cyclobacteriaceae bacterium]